MLDLLITSIHKCTQCTTIISTVVIINLTYFFKIVNRLIIITSSNKKQPIQSIISMIWIGCKNFKFIFFS